ncbi:efflux RND transporter periplasmic adaptor subunit [Arenimonas fontis]|uniref:Efflux RND transporter periplasmic adaptor subunit n=1 Tax=Arenimonas fontis TaxID=2608255 RepID=A0A5B2ZEV8_9GAMM|nr:efflux RND transporter periplasmic adaptor subunit [Arenimonas fontis]KAA2285591.1 efflux RND transporter periplasmic adaptor subunit [Arenimonas fontis]
MKLHRKWLAAGVVLAVIVLPVLIKSVRGEARTEVEVVTAAEQEINPTILASGTVNYLTEVNLTSEVVAKVEEILVKEGDQVEAGQLLLRLDPETYRNAVEREEASRRQSLISIERQRLALALAEKKLERGARLLEQRMIGQEQYDELRNARDLAKVELQGSEEALRRSEAVLGEAREQLAKTDIRAPIAGTIVSLPIKVGETAIPSTNALAGSVLMTIADTSAIEARMKVDEADIARIRLGQKADVYAAAFQDTGVPGVVRQIALAPTVEAQGRAYEVKLLLDVPEGLALRSGMSARADIHLGDGGRSLAVPVEAVVVEEGEDRQVRRHVWLEREGRAEKRAIETGLSDDRWEAVSSGLQAGDRVITGPAKALRTLREGDAVAVKEKGAEDRAGSTVEAAAE